MTNGTTSRSTAPRSRTTSPSVKLGNKTSLNAARVPVRDVPQHDPQPDPPDLRRPELESLDGSKDKQFSRSEHVRRRRDRHRARHRAGRSARHRQEQRLDRVRHRRARSSIDSSQPYGKAPDAIVSPRRQRLPALGVSPESRRRVHDAQRVPDHEDGAGRRAEGHAAPPARRRVPPAKNPDEQVGRSVRAAPPAPRVTVEPRHRERARPSRWCIENLGDEGVELGPGDGCARRGDARRLARLHAGRAALLRRPPGHGVRLHPRARRGSRIARSCASSRSSRATSR